MILREMHAHNQVDPKERDHPVGEVELSSEIARTGSEEIWEVASDWQLRSWHAERHYPEGIASIYREVAIALASHLPLLAAAGLRALIEAVCIAQKASGRNLAQRIDALAASGVLSTAQAEALHSHRFLGNAVLHEITTPHDDELRAAWDIADIVLRSIYEVPRKAEVISTGRKLRLHQGEPESASA